MTTQAELSPLHSHNLPADLGKRIQVVQGGYISLGCRDNFTLDSINKYGEDL